MALLTPDDLTKINKQLQESDSAVQRVPGLDIKEVCEKYCIYEHFMVGKNGDLVPVGEQVLSMGSDYEKFYEEPGIEIILCKGENLIFTLIFWGKDKEEAEAKKQKGFSILKDRFEEAVKKNEIKVGK